MIGRHQEDHRENLVFILEIDRAHDSQERTERRESRRLVQQPSCHPAVEQEEGVYQRPSKPPLRLQKELSQGLCSRGL